MKAAVYNGDKSILLKDVPDPTLHNVADAIVDIEYAGVCGSDLWTYRGQGAGPNTRIGHEFVGTVREVGSEVLTVEPGDWVIVPFRYSCGTCRNCLTGLQSSCAVGGFWGRDVPDSGQAEAARIPYADGTLVKAYPDGHRPDEALIPSLLSLSDVFTTGYHAAKRAKVSHQDVVVVVGDGAVGLSAILSAKLAGADCIICAASSHRDRQILAQKFGADQIIVDRGQAGIDRIRELTGSEMADCVLECVGSEESFSTSMQMLRPGGTLSYVGLPHGVSVDMASVFPQNLTLTGGLSPARAYIPGLLDSVLSGSINPGAVYTQQYHLSDIGKAYEAMDSRRVIKSLIKVKSE